MLKMGCSNLCAAKEIAKRFWISWMLTLPRISWAYPLEQSLAAASGYTWVFADNSNHKIWMEYNLSFLCEVNHVSSQIIQWMMLDFHQFQLAVQLKAWRMTQVKEKDVPQQVQELFRLRELVVSSDPTQNQEQPNANFLDSSLERFTFVTLQR